MRRSLRLLRGAVLLALLLIACLQWGYRAELTRPLSPSPASDGHFKVRPGEGMAEVAAHLKAEGLVKRTWVVRFEARRRGWDRRVIPGWYATRPGDRVRDLFQRFERGDIEQVRMTVPEGWNLPRILAAVAESTRVGRDSLLAQAGDQDWLKARDVPGPGLEGYLFPDTYLMPRGESSRRLLEQMLRPGDRLWLDSLQAEAQALGLDRRELWTMASIIELEAARADERPRISAVFWNRLRRGMRLQSDPTVHYALGRPPGALTVRDIEVDSPYNTYKTSGLPPGPICSPGRASLRAALRPQSGCPDLFFVARGDGSHVFSRSLAEHDRARRAVRRLNSASP